MITKERWDIVLEDPESMFASPLVAVAETELAHEKKIELLKAWERNTSQFLTAIHYGYSFNLGRIRSLELLKYEIHEALASLGVSPNDEP